MAPAMPQAPSLYRTLVVFTLQAVFALLLIPLLTLLFSQHAIRADDAQALAVILPQIEADATIDERLRAHRIEVYTERTVSTVCFDYSEEPRAYREAFCPTGSASWQFSVARMLTVVALVLGLLTLGGVSLLAGLARSNVNGQRAAFMLGWRLLVPASALSITLQAAFVVWLVYWIPAWFWQVSVPKLIVIAAIFVGIGVWVALRALFARPVMDNTLQGEVLEPADAPSLWQRVRAMAAAMGTAPPDHIVAGVDDNFFVVESPLTVGSRVIEGRTLYVSLPLLRVLDTTEADAVLAHELAHFAGGDTASSAALGPLLARFDHYLAHLLGAGFAHLAAVVLRLHRALFELVLQSSSREREFAADAMAARHTEAGALARALVKIAAYSSYRGRIQDELFDHERRHAGALDIGTRVAAGLHAFAHGDAFRDQLQTLDVPHPFDSHPPLAARLAAAGADFGEGDYARIASQPPRSHWLEGIDEAERIEARQWAAFETMFGEAHAESLAYRLDASDDEGRRLVEAQFPPVRFGLKDGRELIVSCDGITTPEGLLVGWDRFESTQYDDAMVGRDTLTVYHPGRTALLLKSRTKIRFNIAGKERQRLKETIGQYWHRHAVMMAMRAERDAGPQALSRGA
jgi:Zn-dependent protease with chaperone function